MRPVPLTLCSGDAGAAEACRTAAVGRLGRDSELTADLGPRRAVPPHARNVLSDVMVSDTSGSCVFGGLGPMAVNGPRYARGHQISHHTLVECFVVQLVEVGVPLRLHFIKGGCPRSPAPRVGPLPPARRPVGQASPCCRASVFGRAGARALTGVRKNPPPARTSTRSGDGVTVAGGCPAPARRAVRRSGSPGGTSRCRPVAAYARPGGTAGSSSGRTGVNRPS